MEDSEVIALASSAVALCAFFVSVFQVFYSARHNKLQVKPLLLVENATDGSDKIIAIHNLGLGPALVRGVTATYKTLKYDLLTQHGLDAVTNHVHGHSQGGFEILTVCLQRGAPIPSSGCEKIIRITGASGTEYEERIDEFVHELHVEVDYACMYGISYKTDNSVE